MAFLTQNNAKLCKILIKTLVFEENANFFAKNCQKSQEIVIITSFPGQCCGRSFRQFQPLFQPKKLVFSSKTNVDNNLLFKMANMFAILLDKKLNKIITSTPEIEAIKRFTCNGGVPTAD
jgi:hypothetical protein